MSNILNNTTELQEILETLSNKTAGGSVSNAVLYTAQTLTDEQKAQARQNIGAQPGENGLSILTTSESDLRYESGIYEAYLDYINTFDGLLKVGIGSLIYAPTENNIYIVKDIDETFAYTKRLANIKGEKGDPYTLTTADKTAITNSIIASLKTETWTFTLEDDSTVTKAVLLK